MKMRFKNLITLVLLLGEIVTANAQINKMEYKDRVSDSVQYINTEIKPPRVKLPPPLRKEIGLGFRLNTDGWGGYLNYGFIKKNEGNKTEIDRFFEVFLLQLELGEKKHPKEYRTTSYDPTVGSQSNFLSLFGTNVFAYGKLNTFYQAKIGVGYKKLIAGKPDPHSVSIHWITIGGPTVGFLKPYYFKSSNGDLKIDPEKAEEMLNSIVFYGAYGIRKGWNELKIVPGLHLKTGLDFDYTNKRKRVAGVEIGVNAEYYFQDIEQMAFQDPKHLFLNAYVSIEIGWRR